MHSHMIQLSLILKCYLELNISRVNDAVNGCGAVAALETNSMQMRHEARKNKTKKTFTGIP
jgi:hypothetical protein